VRHYGQLLAGGSVVSLAATFKMVNEQFGDDREWTEAA